MMRAGRQDRNKHNAQENTRDVPDKEIHNAKELLSLKILPRVLEGRWSRRDEQQDQFDHGPRPGELAEPDPELIVGTFDTCKSLQRDHADESGHIR